MDRLKEMAGSFDIGQIQQFLQGINFPASKDEVASQAESNGAPGDIVSQIRNAAQERFGGPEDVLKAIQGR